MKWRRCELHDAETKTKAEQIREDLGYGIPGESEQVSQRRLRALLEQWGGVKLAAASRHVGSEWERKTHERNASAHIHRLQMLYPFDPADRWNKPWYEAGHRLHNPNFPDPPMEPKWNVLAVLALVMHICSDSYLTANEFECPSDWFIDRFGNEGVERLADKLRTKFAPSLSLEGKQAAIVKVLQDAGHEALPRVEIVRRLPLIGSDVFTDRTCRTHVKSLIRDGFVEALPSNKAIRLTDKGRRVRVKSFQSHE